MKQAYQSRLQRPHLALIGPTGTGKTALAMQLATALNADILSCDSLAVYRGCDIGSAKPTRDQQQQVKHHGLDLVDPNQRFSAAEMAKYAHDVINQADQHGRLVIVVGGSGLYFRAIRYGLAPAPPPHPGLRHHYLAQEQHMPGSLHRLLMRVDPISANKLGPKRLYPLLRALEIYVQSGKTATCWQQQHGYRQPFCPMLAFWCDGDDDWLQARLLQRVQNMLEAGFCGEVARLWQRYGDSLSYSVQHAVGYRQILNQGLAHANTSLATMATTIARASWGYVKKQRTFLRSDQALRLLRMDCTTAEAVLCESRRFLETMTALVI